jgi:CBS-domain-containing membrane protein
VPILRPPPPPRAPLQVLLIGSFGASAVLLYAAPASPLAQPWNVVGGHVLSAVIGVGIRQGINDAACRGQCQWFAAALSVAVSIAAMQVTKCLHPPGGATALIAVTGDTSIRNLGFLYVLAPASVGAVALLLVALLVNNLAPERPYPAYWW